MSQSQRKCLIVGFGSIGRRHLNNALKFCKPDQLAVYSERHNLTLASEFVDVAVFHYWSEVTAWKPDHVVIANSADKHLSTAVSCVDFCQSLLIEKPLSNQTHSSESDLTILKRQLQHCFVAYNFRFCESLLKLRSMLLAGELGEVFQVNLHTGQYLPDWRPGRDYRDTVSARSALGGGVLRELSHEFDYLLWMFGEVDTVMAQLQHSGALEIDEELEDVADILIRFKQGFTANVHLDFLSSPPARSLTLTTSSGTWRWNGVSQTLKKYLPESQSWEVVMGSRSDRNAMYELQMAAFLREPSASSAPFASLDDAFKVMLLIDKIRLSHESKKQVKV